MIERVLAGLMFGGCSGCSGPVLLASEDWKAAHPATGRKSVDRLTSKFGIRDMFAGTDIRVHSRNVGKLDKQEKRRKECIVAS